MINKSLWNFLFVILTFLFLGQGISAQTDRDIYSIPMDSLWDMQISGVSRFKQSLERSPASLIVITEKQIELRGYQDLSDVLKDLPGFDITDNASRFGEYLTMRGIQGNERILVLIDGHKINPPTGTLLSIGNSISVQFAKQIEIIYGPASAMYGADAYAGIINIISKESYKNKSNIRFSGSYASLNSIDAMFESRFAITDELSLSLFGRMFKSDGFDVVGTDTIYNVINRYKAPYEPKCVQPINDFSFFAKLNYKSLTFGYFRQMFSEGNGYTQDPAKNLYTIDNTWKSSSDNIWINYKKEFSKFGTLSADLNGVFFGLDENTQFAKWVQAYQTDLAFSQYMTGLDKAFKGNVNLHKNLSDHFQFILGFDYEHIKSIPPYANDQLFGNSYKFEGSVADSIKEFLTLTENRISGFGQISWSPLQSIDIVIGGRYDYSTRYKQTFNPRLGLTFNPFKKTLFKFTYGTAFQAPSLFFQYEQWGSSTHVMLSTTEVQKLVDPNWELKNQKVTFYELSYTQMLGKSLQFKTSVYHNQLSDIIQRVTFDEIGETYNKYYNNFSKGVRNENVGIQKITGFNAELNYGMKNKFEGFAYYSYTHGISEELEGEVDIPRISENKFWIGASFYNLFEKMTISPRFRWIGEINHSNKTLYPGGKQSGYHSIDLYVAVNQVFKFMKFFVQFNNLLNAKIEHAGLFQQTGGYLPVVSQEGLRIKFGLEFNFIK